MGRNSRPFSVQCKVGGLDLQAIFCPMKSWWVRSLGHPVPNAKLAGWNSRPSSVQCKVGSAQNDNLCIRRISHRLEPMMIQYWTWRKKNNAMTSLMMWKGDSLSALQAIQSKNFKVIDIRRLYNLIRIFPPYVHISFVWIPVHVGIQGNENVDKLAKAALIRTSCSGKLICWSDQKSKINACIHSVWQRNWDAEGANKLHEVLPNLGEDLHRRGKGAGRKRETAMCRLRVGQRWLTQSYLLKMRNNFFALPATAFTLSGIF
ncbi:ribonuclease hi [Plakobranchus ocellatus]|uniref:Ribonuclease hi n=1 Tax=Plakobranchus ocellatus TaxID=259542 RepID=A0AAV4ART3_9GAST|nr:ribonuclease hi [Plakobranchus ocellatus]